MYDERSIKHPLKFDIAMYNAEGVLFPSAYQKLTMNMIEEHLDQLNLGQKALMPSLGISWVLLYNCVEFRRKIHPEDQLTGRTWHSEGRAPLFRRDFQMISENDGEVVAVGATLSTLFDHTARRVCIDRQKTSIIDLSCGETLLDIERRFVCPKEMKTVEKRLARPSMTDGIGHVNNTRYGEFVYDAMTEEERKRLSDLARMDSWFFSELRAGDEFEIRHTMVDENTSVYVGVKCDDGKQSFAIKFKYN